MKPGYAFKKAVELIAFEKGVRDKSPNMPSSKALRGAIATWKNKLENKYRPRLDESKIVFQKTIQKENIGDDRPFLRVEGQYHSKRIGNDIRDVIYGFGGEDMKTGSPKLLEISDDEIDEMHEIASQLGIEKNPKTWNKVFEQSDLDVEVWTEKYL